MNSQPYLIFELNHKRYGFDAHVVEEIFLLPEITPIPDASSPIVGVINLRGNILPILDLSQRIEGRPHRFAVSDSIIVITQQQQRVGLVVSQVYEVEFITPQVVESDYLLDGNRRHSALVTGIAKLDAQLINLIDTAVLMRLNQATSETALCETDAIAHASQRPTTNTSTEDRESHRSGEPSDNCVIPALPESAPGLSSTDYFFPTATDDERTVLHTRAQNLLATLEQDNSASLTPLAVIRFGEERFAIGVDVVQEFTDIRQVTPVPCCPPHVIGNMNLRGEVLTLIDVRHLLQIQNHASRTTGKAVVIKLDDLVAGIAVDEVFDVVYIHPSEISTIPTAVHTAKQEYLRGVVAYENSFMGVLDLPEMLANSELVVNEAI